MTRIWFFFFPLIAFVAALPLDAAYIYDNIRKIDLHNANPNKTFFMRFSDISALTPEEYNIRLGFRPTSAPVNGLQYKKSSNFSVPDAVDWRQKGMVNSVKDQGSCGSCWAFSAIGALEGQHAIKRGNILDLSEQNIVDCSHNGGNNGCHGGWMNMAFEYMWRDGVDTDKTYPYVARDEKCKFKKANVGETMHAYYEAVANLGPIAVAIDASHSSFQNYGGGVYYEPACSVSQICHAVLVVGYGHDARGGDYWLVKNRCVM